jgi:putative transposase
MEFETGKYYHFYNRSNNEELLFKSEENYDYFLKKYSDYFGKLFSTLAYCLMPTHFHFLIKVKEMSEIPKMSDTFKVSYISTSIEKNIGILLSSYTKAINKRYKRHGSLFQLHSKAKEIEDEQYLLTLISYIHQNPVRSRLVTKAEEWKYSSYQDLIGSRNGELPDREFFRQYFKTNEERKKYSEEIVSKVKKEYWV